MFIHYTTYKKTSGDVAQRWRPWSAHFVHKSAHLLHINLLRLLKLAVSYKHEIHSRNDKSPYIASPESSPDSHIILLTKYVTNLLTE